jgi:hypothetical protein
MRISKFTARWFHAQALLTALILFYSWVAAPTRLSAQATTTLAQLAAQMQPGTWAELKSIGFNNQLLTESADFSYISRHGTRSADLFFRQIFRSPHCVNEKFR